MSPIMISTVVAGTSAPSLLKLGELADFETALGGLMVSTVILPRI
jgi:hypothetical protein